MKLSELSAMIADNPDLRAQVDAQLDKTKKGRGRRRAKSAGTYKSEVEACAAEYIMGLALPGSMVYEPFTLRLEGGEYTPDFLFVDAETLVVTLVEVKGSWRAKNARDSRTKLRAAAARYWFFGWLALSVKTKRRSNKTMVVDEWKVEAL